MLVQVNARAPEEGRHVLLKVAARMREEPAFIATLEAFLAGDDVTPEWRDDLADLRSRIEALEAAMQKGATGRDRDTPSIVEGSIPVEGCLAPGIDWQARAAAVTISTGEGRGRKLTAEGEALLSEMIAAGERAPTIARVLGMAPQSVHYRLAKVQRQGSPSA